MLAVEITESVCCPSCQGKKLVATKENILICHSCLNGYKVREGVPDFRKIHTISFKKKLAQFKKSDQAVMTTVIGTTKNVMVTLLQGQCCVVGRQSSKADVEDLTFVGRPVAVTHSTLDSSTQALIEKYLSLDSISVDNLSRAHNSDGRFLADYARIGDFLLEDSSVSRAHALIYHNEQGVYVLDLVSKNGTYVNGTEIEHRQLRDGEMFTVGGHTIRVTLK